MSDQTAVIILLGISLLGCYYLARGSRRARTADAMNRHPAGTAHQRAQRAAADVQARKGSTAWFKCAVCRLRVRIENLTIEQLLDICDDRTPTCPTCADTLAAAEEEMSA